MHVMYLCDVAGVCMIYFIIFIYLIEACDNWRDDWNALLSLLPEMSELKMLLNCKL